MKANRHYIVTKGSDDGTFQVGDHIHKDTDGAIICLEAQGWMSPEDIPEATKGVKIKLDIRRTLKFWLTRLLAYL